MQAIGYLRVSTATQAEEGLGLEVQEQAVRKYARKHKLELIDVASDEGCSGATLERAGLVDVLRAIRDGKAEAVVVYRLDRLARDLIAQEQLLAEVRRHGGRVLSCSDAETDVLADDPDDPSRKLIRQVLGSVSEFERAMIALRLRNGRRAKHDAGGFAYGSPPYGWRSEAGELVVVPEQQAVIARVVELRKSERLSVRRIAEVLNEEGAVPPRSGRWSAEIVRRVLQRAGVKTASVRARKRKAVKA